MGQTAYMIWFRIKDMIFLNKQLSYKQLIQEPYCQPNAFSNLKSYTKNNLELLELNYTLDEIVQYFASILFINPWSKIFDISPFQKNMKDASFLFHTEPIEFYKYFRASITNILLDNLNKNIEDIFNSKNIKNLYPKTLTINQLYVLSFIYPEMFTEKSIYFNMINNWSTICQYDLIQHVEGGKKIINKLSNGLIKIFNVV